MNTKLKIYTKDGCRQCNFTKNMLDDKGLEYDVINVDDTPEAINDLLELGFMQFPVVVPTSGEAFSGFRPDRLEAL